MTSDQKLSVERARQFFEDGVNFYKEPLQRGAAIAAWQSALSDYETLLKQGGHQDDNLLEQVGKTQANLGAVHQSQGQFKEALIYYHDSLSVYLELIGLGRPDLREGAAMVRMNIGNSLYYLNGNNNDEAFSWQRAALAEFRILIDEGHPYLSEKAIMESMTMSNAF